MAIVAQKPTGAGVQYIECDVEGSAKAGWNCCQLEQFCNKLMELNEQAGEGDLGSVRGQPNYDDLRGEGNDAAEEYRDVWNQLADDGTLNAIDDQAPHLMRDKFFADCAYEQSRATVRPPPAPQDTNFHVGPEMQPDHEHELQFGGDTAMGDLMNLRWLDTSVNRSLGSTLRGHDPATYPGGINADCCPADETYCAGKTPDDPVVT